eukprot:6798145-Prymnesium_polylepis.2
MEAVAEDTLPRASSVEFRDSRIHVSDSAWITSGTVTIVQLDNQRLEHRQQHACRRLRVDGLQGLQDVKHAQHSSLTNGHHCRPFQREMLHKKARRFIRRFLATNPHDVQVLELWEEVGLESPSNVAGATFVSVR